MSEKRIKAMVEYVAKQNKHHRENLNSDRSALWVTPSAPIQLDPWQGEAKNLVHGVLLHDVEVVDGCLLGVVQSMRGDTWEPRRSDYGPINLNIPIEHIVSAHILQK